MIAGPYLYTFNRWAVSWLENQGIETFITPIENSRKNLETTFDLPLRKKVMITLFAYPALFRMRFKLPESYDFTYFTDKQGQVFKTLSTQDGSFVMPEQPFSIMDVMQRMKGEGFTHFLIDFSRTAVAKNDFRFIMRTLYKGDILPESDRFNWKDGFYSPEKIENFRLAAERAAAEQSEYGYNGRSSSRDPAGRYASGRGSAGKRNYAAGKSRKTGASTGNAGRRGESSMKAGRSGRSGGKNAGRKNGRY